MEILVVVADVIEKLILLILAGLSVWSVAIMLDRRRLFQKQTETSFDQIRDWIEKGQWDSLKDFSQNSSTFLAGGLAAILSFSQSQAVDRAVASYIKKQKLEMEKGLSILATLGSNAPFIGLFGTVLGVLRAFAFLGSQSGSAAVMSGVSQALVVTAAGLFVAIPAVIAFNIFTQRMRDLVLQLESLRDLYLAKSGKVS